MKAAAVETLAQRMRARDDRPSYLYEPGAGASGPYRLEPQRRDHHRRIHDRAFQEEALARLKTQVDPAAAITFAPFRLDPSRGRLLRGDQSIRLRPKTWSVLLYLAQRPGVLVTKDELLDAVWPDVVITPDTLSKSIGELRVALADNYRTPRCIETVHRRGYRFVAVTSAGPAQVSDPTPGPAETRACVCQAAEFDERVAKASGVARRMALVAGAAGIEKTDPVDRVLNTLAEDASDSPTWRRAEVAYLRGAPNVLVVVIDDERLCAPSSPGGALLTRKERQA
jgi:DNA-binding winged helix-turn-helix (wHTH) protein